MWHSRVKTSHLNQLSREASSSPRGCLSSHRRSDWICKPSLFHGVLPWYMGVLTHQQFIPQNARAHSQVLFTGEHRCSPGTHVSMKEALNSTSKRLLGRNTAYDKLWSTNEKWKWGFNACLVLKLHEKWNVQEKLDPCHDTHYSVDGGSDLPC